MFFNSIEFFIFITWFILFYFTSKGNYRLLVLLGFSLFFYGWHDPKTIFLLLFLIGFNYFLAIKIDSLDSQSKKTSFKLGILVNLLLLIFFKYTNFFIKNSEFILNLFAKGTTLSFINTTIVLPIGISFYIFEMISYLSDVYQNRISSERNILKFSLYISFFPRLIAGPIMRAGYFLPQIDKVLYKNPDWETIIGGIQIILWGFFKKVVIADSLALFVDTIFQSPSNYTSLTLIIAVLFYTFQIYCDFSGYSDIAIGLGKIVGFDLGANFDRPYFSTSFSQFWSRWHISLSSWLKDYIYIPLGGNRISVSRTYQNLLITMLLGGLWHGANWTFVIWGAIHGMYLILQRLLSPTYQKLIKLFKISKLASDVFLVLLVFCLTAIAWIFFRVQNFDDAITIIDIIFRKYDWNFSSIPSQFQVIKGFLLCFILVVVEAISFYLSFPILFKKHPLLRLFMGCFILYAIALLGSFKGQTFIYFQF
jgi:alginate O-acetyltransferase complex protein AlgI